MNKKKYHGGLKVLLLLLFIMLLGICSTSYAYVSGSMTEQRATYIFDYALTNRYNTYNYFSMNWIGNTSVNADSWGIYQKSNLASYYGIYNSNNNIGQFMQVFNQKNAEINNNLGVEHYLFIPYFDGSGIMTIVCIPNNNGIGNELPHLRLSFSYYSSSSFSLKVEYDEPLVDYKILRFDVTSQGVTFKNDTLSVPFYFICRKNNIDAFYARGNSTDVYYSPLNIICLFRQTFYSRTGTLNQTDTNITNWYPYWLYSFYEEETTPTTPPTTPTPGESGTITNPEGEVTGQIDLSGIENGIKDVKDTISGEAKAIRDTISGETEKVINTLTDVPDLSGDKISSGDISSALGFEFETDRYANFWLDLTNGLKNALLGVNRTITISFMGNSWLISLDDFAILPDWLRIILIPFSTSFFVWVLVRWWKLIIDKLSSGNVDVLLKENSEERNFKFVLGGVILLDSVFNFILNLFFWLVGVIGSVVIYPVQAILVTLVPSIGDYLSIFLNFFRESVFPMISFAKELFLDITCCPRPLFTILITTLFARWAIAPAIRSILLIMNIWKIKSGGKTE